MRKQTKKLLINGSAILLLCVSHTVSANKESLTPTLKHNVFDGACLYMKKKNLLRDYSNEIGHEHADTVKAIWNKATKNKTPLCEITSPAGVLLVTANFVDHATLNAARGIDSIERALGLKQTLTNVILELEQALQGEDPAAQVNAKTVNVTTTIGERAKEIEKEIAERKHEINASAELRALIVQSQMALNTANYYQLESALGARTFREYWNELTEAERHKMIQQNSKLGLNYQFATELPERALRMVANVVDTVTLATKLNKALDSESIEKHKKELKKSHKSDSKKATQIAKEIDARTTNTFSVATADNPASAKQYQAAQTPTATEDSSCQTASDNDDKPWKKLTGNLLKKAVGQNVECP